MRKLPSRPIPSNQNDGGVTVLPIPDRVVSSPDAFSSSVASASSRREDAVPPPVPPRPVLFSPLAPDRYKVQFTAGVELRDKLERLRALLRSEVPDGDLAAIIETAVTEKLDRLEARRFGRTRSPRKNPARSRPDPSSRRIPAAVRRAVHRRDGGRCCFVDARGRRGSERHRLEYHHRHPFGLGGGHDSGQHLPDVPDPRPLPCRDRLRDEGARSALGTGSGGRANDRNSPETRLRGARSGASPQGSSLKRGRTRSMGRAAVIPSQVPSRLM